MTDWHFRRVQSSATPIFRQEARLATDGESVWEPKCTCDHSFLCQIWNAMSVLFQRQHHWTRHELYKASCGMVLLHKFCLFSQPQMLLDNLSSFSFTSNDRGKVIHKHSQHIKCYRPNYYIFKCTQDVHEWFWIMHPGCSCQGNDEVYTKCRHTARCYQHVQYLCICTTYKRWPQIDCAIFDSYHKIAQLYLKLPLLLSILAESVNQQSFPDCKWEPY